MQVNFHTKEPVETSVRSVKSGGAELVDLRIQADGNMVDFYFHDASDAYALLNAVNEVLDLLEGV